MQQVLPGVFVVPCNGRKGFGYAHFVRRRGGNLLLDTDRTASISDAFDELEAAGGVRAVVVSDRHLGGKSSNEVAQRFGATVYASAIEAEAMGHRSNPVRIDHALPLQRTTVEGDVELIPTPGHTEGQFSTLVDVEGARCLFTADFVYRKEGAWVPGNASRKKMLRSFEGLRELAFEYVVPWTSYSQTEFFVPVSDVDATVLAMIAACSKP
jgi:glyoxylase-like metal-dependent hydrolase (beta-lactamase superfamily II)